jgi:uncharacterized membrane protein
MRRLVILSTLALTACTAQKAPPLASPATASVPDSVRPPAGFRSFSAIGTEPFWSITTSDTELVYTTPEQPDGVRLMSGWGIYGDSSGGATEQKHLSFVAKLNGEVLILEIRPGECSDGMSDTVYAYKAKLKIGERTEQGCAKKL